LPKYEELYLKIVVRLCNLSYPDDVIASYGFTPDVLILFLVLIAVLGGAVGYLYWATTGRLGIPWFLGVSASAQ